MVKEKLKHSVGRGLMNWNYNSAPFGSVTKNRRCIYFVAEDLWAYWYDPVYSVISVPMQCVDQFYL